MILTIVLNPSVEKTAIVDGVEINQVNQIEDYRLIIGPSAIYSAVVAKVLQGDPYVIGFAGGIGGRYIKNFMDKSKIKSDLIWKDMETRSTLKVIDSIHMTETKFVDRTFSFDENDLKYIKNKFVSHSRESNVMVINDGNASDEKIVEMVEALMDGAKDNGIKTIISLAGNQLRKTLDYHPFSIALQKKDLVELEIDTNVEHEELLEQLRIFTIQYKIRYLIYDDGKSIYMIAKNKICSVSYYDFLEQKEELGSKDAIVGGLSVAISRQYEMERTTKLLGAITVAMNVDNYPIVVCRKDIDHYSRKLKVREIYNKRDSYLKLEMN